MKRGLTLGKYAPLHRGHQLVIETALVEADEVVAVIYDAPDETSVPLPVRAGWLRRLYPSLQVIEAYGPTAVGYTPDIMRAHETFLIDTLGIRDITHFYSSEPYGEHVSSALGAVDRRVDQARRKVPISATAIRNDPFVHRSFMEPLVYADLIVNVAILGAPGTGKTTLARRLAHELRTEWMPEYGREYWEKHQIDRRLTPEQLAEIAEGHIEREQALLLQANRYLVTDTNALTTAAFGQYYHGAVHPLLAALADNAVSRYDLTVVCNTYVPYEDTWDRSGEVNRQAFQQQVLADLDRRRVPFVLLKGSRLEDRVAEVVNLLKHHSKRWNSGDLKGTSGE